MLQLIVFQAGYTNYATNIMQCVGTAVFASPSTPENLYNIFMLVTMFLAPWSVLLFGYVYIYRVVKSTQDLPDDLEQYALTSCKHMRTTCEVELVSSLLRTYVVGINLMNEAPPYKASVTRRSVLFFRGELNKTTSECMQDSKQNKSHRTNRNFQF